MPYFPLNVNLVGKKCVVIGGGAVSERKVETLVDFGASVLIASPDLTPVLSDFLEQGLIEHFPGVYAPQLLDGAFLVIAGTNDREVNQAVSIESQSRGILVNVVDDPELCTFFMPAIVAREDLVISVSTSGRSPALARRVRERLETEFGPEYGDLVRIIGNLRDEVKAQYSDPADRNQAFLRIIDSAVLDLLREGRHDEAVVLAHNCIQPPQP